MANLKKKVVGTLRISSIMILRYLLHINKNHTNLIIVSLSIIEGIDKGSLNIHNRDLERQYKMHITTKDNT